MKNQLMRLENVIKYKRRSVTLLKKVEHAKKVQVSSNGTIPINQIKEFIMWTIKDKYEVSTKSSLTYARPYTTRIDT